MLCPNHASEDRLASRLLQYCGECITQDSKRLEAALESHRVIRRREGLVEYVPKKGDVVCPECGNHCRLENGQLGFCNLRKVENGKIVEMFPGKAIVHYYFDRLPTNCCADWVCPCKEDISQHSRGWLNNLAVFYGSCSSDCLFCQNTSYRSMMKKGRPLMTPRELADAADERTACICYFGGDPSCNPQHSIETSEILIKERNIRVCYETSGQISAKYLDKIGNVVENSGGTIKIDLKAITPEIYTALTGINNRVVLNNFQKLSERGKTIEGEFLVAAILLVPGYIGVNEVRKLCEFIAVCDSSIPTSLLGFAPHHAMADLPRTSRNHAESAREVALEAGLTNVRIGNMGLLSRADYDCT